MHQPGSCPTSATLPPPPFDLAFPSHRVTGLEYFIHASTRETGVRCTLAFEVLGSRSVTVELLPPDVSPLSPFP